MKKKVEKKPFLSTPLLVIITVVVVVLLAVLFNPKSYEFKEITANDFTELYNSNEKSIVFIGTPTCSYCVKFTPVLKKVADNYELQINYLNLSTLDETTGKQFYATDKYFTQEQWGTPLVIIVGDKKLDEKKLNGYTEEEAVIEYFKSVGMIK